MLVTRLREKLNSALNKSENNTILIDGKWGCGKTYSIKEFIDKDKKNSSILSFTNF